MIALPYQVCEYHVGKTRRTCLVAWLAELHHFGDYRVHNLHRYRKVGTVQYLRVAATNRWFLHLRLNNGHQYMIHVSLQPALRETSHPVPLRWHTFHRHGYQRVL
ncbi:hypothetical protein D3C78_1631770 [compost metagenome]